MEQTKVLLLDDEECILKALQRVMRRKAIDVVTFLDPDEALAYLKEHDDIQVIISDMRMPMMTGAEFLEKAKSINPTPTRIVLSGFSERESLLHAINQGKIWRFMSKPWDNDDLIQTINNAVEVYESKIEKEHLITKLHTQNQELESMNQLLETRVKDRTRELEVRSKWLESLLDCEDTCSLIGEVSEQLDILTGIPGHMIQAIDEGSVLPESCFPLLKGGRAIGMIQCMKAIEKNSEHYMCLSRFSPVISMIIDHEKMNGNGDLMKNVETWLGESS
jgi:response regulator RpfG family c-di-GMP phosphodiesterase